MIAYAIDRLGALPGAAVYVDAGHSAWVPAPEMASRLLAAGIQRAAGFSLNVSNYQATGDVLGYGRQLSALVGGKGSLEAGKPPVKTVGSYWPYATTLFDYIRRAMPFLDSKSLTDDEVYAVSAYILNLNEIIGKDDVLDAQSLPKVRMPNRDGFIPFPRSPK